MSNFYLMTRAAYEKLSRPLAKAALRAGFTPDSITILGTAGTVLSALTLFPIGQLWWGAFSVCIFVLADMLDGRDEEAFERDSELIGPYLTLAGGRMYEQTNIRWCTAAIEALSRRLRS